VAQHLKLKLHVGTILLEEKLVEFGSDLSLLIQQLPDSRV
jgi:hypothetical protein